MTEQNSPDRFSAFLDGEIAAADAERLRRELEASPKARAEVADYQRLSSLLNELPQERLGPEFSAAVLRGIERSMLIPAAELLAAKKKSSWRNRWVPAIAALAASAAVLFISIRLLDGRRDRANEAGDMAVAEAHQPRATGDAKVAARSADATATSVAETSAAPSPPASDPTATPESRPVARAKSDASFDSGTVAPVPAEESLVVDEQEAKIAPSIVGKDSVDNSAPSDDLMLPVVEDQPRLEFNANLEQAQIGEVVQALERSGDNVSVLRLTVVDKIEGLEHLQVLLSRNSIHVADVDDAEGNSDAKSTPSERQLGAIPQPADKATTADESIATRQDSGAEFDGAKNHEQFYCVLVKADSTQLTEALWELRNQPTFQELRIEDTPIALAELDDFVPTVAGAKALEVFRQHMGNRRRGSSGLDASDVAKTERDTLESADSAPEANALTEEKLSASKTPGESAEVAESPETAAQQMKLTLPSGLFSKTRQMGKSSESGPKKARQAQAPPREKVAENQSDPSRQSKTLRRQGAGQPRRSVAQKKNAAPEPAHPVQVLFVLEVGGSPPANAAPTKAEPAP